MRRLALFALIASACSGLDLTERGLCGNDIVEPGEDCDGAEYCDKACAISCDPDGGCHQFAGYVCGGDGLCHAPGGEFAPPTTLAFAAIEARIFDVDRDRAGDIVGVGTTSIVTVFGDPTASFARRANVATPAVQGAFAVTDLQQDPEQDPLLPIVDVVIPTVDGIVSYSSRFGSLSAEPFPADLTGDQGGSPLAMFGIETTQSQNVSDRTRVGIFSSERDPVTGEDVDTLVFKIIDVSEGPKVDDFPLCGRRGQDFHADRVDTYSIVAPGSLELVSVMVLGSPGALSFCAFSMKYDESSDSYTITELPELTIVTPTERRPVLVDLTAGDHACPSLVLPEQSAAQYTYVPGKLVTVGSGTFCGFDTTTRTVGVADVDPDVLAVGRIRVEPPIAGVAPDALVLEAGIFVTDAGGSAQAIHRSDRRIARVISADIDGDGRLDAITTGRDAPDLELLLRAPSSGSDEGFLPIRIPTAGIPTEIVVGDFDGNSLPDVVFGERLGEFERLLIAYGTPDRLLEPIHAASFGKIIAFAPANVRGSTDPTAVVLDLAVIDLVPGASEQHRLTALQGSPGRTLIPVFTPGVLGDAERFHAVIAGELGRDARGDLLVIDRDPTRTGSLGAMWRLFGEVGGLDNEDLAIESSIHECPTGLCSTARYLIDDSLVIALDAFGSAAKFDPAPDEPACGVPPFGEDECPAKSIPIPQIITTQTPIVPRPPLAFDIGGDGSIEIILAYRIPPNEARQDRGDVRVCDRELACQSILGAVRDIDGDVEACIDAAAGTLRLGGRELPAPPRELVLLCQTARDTRLFRMESRTVVSRIDGFVGALDAHSLLIGDVTGDAVDDVVVLRATAEGSSIDIVRQLTSREEGAP